MVDVKIQEWASSPVMFYVSGADYPPLYPVAVRGAKQRQSSKHSRRGALGKPGYSDIEKKGILIISTVVQVAYKKYLLEKYERDSQAV